LLLQNMAVMRGHTVQELRQQARGGDAWLAELRHHEQLPWYIHYEQGPPHLLNANRMYMKRYHCRKPMIYVEKVMLLGNQYWLVMHPSYTQTFNLCTRYPLLLGGQRQCGFKSCPRIWYMTSVPGMEPQTSRSQVQHLTTEPRTLYGRTRSAIPRCWSAPTWDPCTSFSAKNTVGGSLMSEGRSWFPYPKTYGKLVEGSQFANRSCSRRTW
jgi:hypothetical protein